MAIHNVELYGRKTFFIAPDTSLIPKSYLEEFLGRGYETYVINDDYTCPLQTKIQEIIKLFPDSIFYFNIDASVEGIEWKSYIRELRENFGNQLLIGIFYLKRQNPEDEEKIKTYYVRDVQIRAGCFALSAHNHDNFDAILGALAQSGARGRRNQIAKRVAQSSLNTMARATRQIFLMLMSLILGAICCRVSKNLRFLKKSAMLNFMSTALRLCPTQF